MDPLPALEESLRQSQQIIHSILDTIPVRVFWKDRELKYLGCNRPFAEDAGFHEPKDLVGKDDYAMGWRDQAEIYRADDRSVIESGIAKVMIEEPQKTPDGRIIWLLTSKVPLRDAKGEISGVLGAYMDITQYRNAQESIRESEEKYRAFFATSKDVVFITSKDGSFVDFNDEAPAFFGYLNREEFRTVNVKDLYCNTDERQHHIKVIERSGFVKDYPVDLRKKDGSIIHALITSIARKDLSGNVVGFQGTIKDITEQKKSQEALGASEEKFRSIFNSINDGIHLHEIESDGMPGKFIDVNDVACRMLQYSREDMLSKSPLDFVTRFHDPPVEEVSRDLRTKGHAFFETGHIRRDGTVVPVEINAHIVSFSGTNLVVAVIRDITERKKAENALKENNERYISYIKEAAMRLKTPVEVVERNITSVIRDIDAGDLEKDQILLELRLQVKNMEQIRQNILDLNKTIVDRYGEISPASKQFLTE